MTYNRNEQIGVESGEGYTLTGNPVGFNAGEYSAIATLLDTETTEWSDGTIDPKMFDWVIAKASLKITAEDKNVIVGNDTPQFTVSYRGLMTGDSISSSIDGIVTYECEYDLLSPVGDYTIFVSGLTSSNYEIEFVNGTLSLSQKIIASPNIRQDLFFIGFEQSGIESGDGYTLTGDSSGLNAQIR